MCPIFNGKETRYFYSKTNKMHQCIKFILFWNDILHVSDGLSIHHQEFKTVHTATDICQTDNVVCLLASRQLANNLSANLYDIYLCCVYSEKLLMMDRGTTRNV